LTKQLFSAILDRFFINLDQKQAHKKCAFFNSGFNFSAIPTLTAQVSFYSLLL